VPGRVALVFCLERRHQRPLLGSGLLCLTTIRQVGKVIVVDLVGAFRHIVDDGYLIPQILAELLPEMCGRVRRLQNVLLRLGWRRTRPSPRHRRPP
jgi:hypothetical protein